MNMGTNDYEELKKFFEELFKDENILEAMRNTTIVPERPPEWLNTFAEFNPPQVSEDEMKAALVRMSIMDCSGPDRMGRTYSKETITKAWKDWFNESEEKIVDKYNEIPLVHAISTENIRAAMEKIQEEANANKRDN